MIGEIHENRFGQKYEIIGYIEKKQARLVKFESGYERIAYCYSMGNNSLIDYTAPSLYGIGVIGFPLASYHPLFTRWTNMMTRCYNKNNKKYKSYGGKGVIVSEELHYFSNYIKVVEGLDNYDKLIKNPEEWQIDKDLLSNKNNKIYSSETLTIMSGCDNNDLAKKEKRRPVIQYDLNMNKIAEFESITSADKNTGVTVGNIHGVANRKYNTAGGFIWRFKEDKE